MRGLGRIFKRGDIWWIAVSHRGREVRETSHSTREADAKRLLKRRLGEIGRGRLIAPSEERVSFDSMAEDFLADYRINGRRSVESAELSVRHLRSFLGVDRALDITTDRVRAYVSYRQAQARAMRASTGSSRRSSECSRSQ
jgi:hypothetical protein